MISFEEETDTITDFSTEVFGAGEKVDAEIVSETEMFVDLQFGDGSVAHGVWKGAFEVLKEENVNLAPKTNVFRARIPEPLAVQKLLVSHGIIEGENLK